MSHEVLVDILKQYIPDKDTLQLLRDVIRSFSGGALNTSLPLGNITSQLFVNVYMNEFDQFVRHRLKVKYYLRYADDFVILSENREWLEEQVESIKEFLLGKLKLELHPQKIYIKTFASGVDFLGWVHFPDHRILRTTTKKRMFKRIYQSPVPETFNSYLGLLSHGNTDKLQRRIHYHAQRWSGEDFI